MKQQKFLFVDLVSSIFLLVILIGNFMGLLYILEGNYILSFLASVFLTICYFFIVILLKNNKEAMYKSNFMHGSILFWIIFLVLTFSSYTLMSHFINIEYNCKDEIKKEAAYKLSLVDSLKKTYIDRSRNDILDFEAQMKTKLSQYISTKKSSLKNELLQSPYRIENTVLENPNYINIQEVAAAKIMPYQLKIEKNKKNIEKTIELNNKKYQSIFNNWKRLSLVDSYNNLNKYVDDNLNVINGYIEELPLNNSKIELSIDKKQLPLNSPSELSKTFKPNVMIPALVILFTHLFILIPFLAFNVRAYENTKSNNTGTIEL